MWHERELCWTLDMYVRSALELGSGRQGELSSHLTSTPLLLPLELLLQHCHSSSSVEDGDQRSFGACWSLLFMPAVWDRCWCVLRVG